MNAPPREQASGGADLQGKVTIIPTGDASCRVALATTVRLGGLLRFVEGVARSRIEAGAPAMAASVKAWLERDPPVDAAADDGQTRPG